MFSLSNEDKADAQRRAHSLGLGPCVRFSKDAREVLIGKSPVSKNKFNTRFLTREKHCKKIKPTVSKQVSHPPRVTVIHQDSQLVFHQRPVAQITKNTRKSFCRHMHSFGSIRRRISSFGLQRTVPEVGGAISQDLVTPQSSSNDESDKSRRKRFIRLSHISSRLRNKLRLNYTKFQPVTTTGDNLSTDGASFVLDQDRKYIIPKLNQRNKETRSIITDETTLTLSEMLSTFPDPRLEKRKSAVNDVAVKQLQVEKYRFNYNLRSKCFQEFNLNFKDTRRRKSHNRNKRVTEQKKTENIPKIGLNTTCFLKHHKSNYSCRQVDLSEVTDNSQTFYEPEEIIDHIDDLLLQIAKISTKKQR